MYIRAAARTNTGIIDAHLVDAFTGREIAKCIIGVGALIVSTASGLLLAEALAIAFLTCGAGLVTDTNA